MVKMTNIKHEGDIVSCDCLGDGREKFFLKFNVVTGEIIEMTTDCTMYISEARSRIFTLLWDNKKLPEELTAMSY